ncbi:phage tail protein [Thalassomonas sp. RHCl1]|uniref:phage tail-collar fiber domain-containing protein n=1 Tax=Thalassomonas sp. RHCl1 TaxID=2995320 RepID=UPI00248BAF32|nr:phage tail protein [Thalassomonas sp. RHCl1]
MSTILTPTITEAGLQALFNAQSNGLQAQISAIALGDSAYTPQQNRTALTSEKNRIKISSGTLVSPTQLHMSVIDDSNKTFWVREVGFYLDDGTLFAVYSEPDKTLAYKSPEVDLLLAFDLALSGVPAGSVNIIDQGVDLNILIAPELAKMATAQISNMYRHVKHSFLLQDAGLI